MQVQMVWVVRKGAPRPGMSRVNKVEPAMTQSFTHARFWRCALQVNPVEYSIKYRGKDHGLAEDAYHQALLEQCKALDIKVIGIADHGSVESVDRVREFLTPHGLVVFPGFEIASTEKIHMVCLFPELTTKHELTVALGKLGVDTTKTSTWPSEHGCLKLAEIVEKLGGFWYAAHITGASGLLRLNKDGGGLPHIWTDHRSVRVAQIPGPPSELAVSYRQIVENTDPNYKRERPIIVINAKDVAKPEDLSDPAATCWIKMTRPTFDAFKVAFLDPESRIRLKADMKTAPHGAIREMQVQRGYLDGLSLELSEHLNAVIGGRGTGKSTLIEFLRYALEVPPKGKDALRRHQDIIKENLGKESGQVELAVESAAQHGKLFMVSRRYGEPPIVVDDAGNVSQLQPSDLFPSIEIYGQNEIYELAQDPQSQRKLLERFLPLDSEAVRQREQLHKRLQDNQQRLLKALDEHEALHEQAARLPKLTEQLQGFQAMGIEAKLAKIPLFARERQVVDRISEELQRVAEAAASLRDSIPDLTFLSDKTLEGLPHASLLLPMRQTLEALRADLQQQLIGLQRSLAQSNTTLEPQMRVWNAAVTAGQREVEEAVAALPDMAGKSGREVGTAYRMLTEEIERIKPLDARLATIARLRASLEQERKNVLAELSALRSRRATALQQAVKDLNERLKGQLRVGLAVESERAPLREFLAACRLDGVGEKRLAWIDERDALTPLALAQAIRAGQATLAAQYSISPVVADALVKLPRAKLLELEALELEDRVTIELNVAHGLQVNYRDLEHLSIGQKCTAVLHLLLLENPDPLIVDQPEDNLDNAFIAERIVRELRRAKTERQFLFSTHNANIPVFGDAEWIGVLSSPGSGSTERLQQGSIDVHAIRDQVATILEGGRDAFMQRKEKYDY